MEPAKAVIFTIRYSVLLRKSNFVLIGQDVAFEEYQRRLFDPKRLECRYRLFSTLTLPSLARVVSDATEAKVGVYIMVSTELPEAHRKIFDAGLATYPWAKVVAVGPDDRMPHRQCVLDLVQSLNADSVAYAHCRLDDDDMVSNDFANQLSAYLKPEYVGLCVSLGMGYSAVYDESQCRISRLFEYHSPKVSAGLALIGSYDAGLHKNASDIVDVYALGGHPRVDRRVPVILDSRRPSFVRTIHSTQDTGGSGGSREAKSPDPAIVAKLFAFDVGDLPTQSQSDAAGEEMNRLERERRKANMARATPGPSREGP